MNEDVHILLVTSDPGTLDTRAEALESAGYRSASADTGEDGLRLARDIRPDLMVVEAPLPDVPAEEVCRRVKAEPSLRDTFLVLLAADDDQSDREISAREAEADIVLPSPVAERELAPLVASFLRIQRTEQKLRASEARYRDVVENAPLGIYRTTPEGDILMANSALVEMLGYDSFADLARRDLESEGYHPDYPRAEFKRRMKEDGQVRGLEAAWKRKDGSTLYVRENARAVRDDRGHLICYQGTVEDVTKRVMQARRLKRLNTVLATIRGVNELITHEQDRTRLIEAACNRLVVTGVYETAWIGLLDEDGGLKEAAEKGLGDAFAAITERLSQGETDVCSDQALARNDVCVCDAPQEGPLADAYHKQKLMAVRLAQSGEIFGLLTVSVPVQLEVDERETELLEEMANDIAFALRTIDLEKERRQAHQALQESERRQSLILNATAELFTYTNTDLEIQWTNQAAARAMGLPPEDLVGRHCYEVWALRQVPCEGCPVLEALETGEAHEAEQRTPDGRFWHMRAYPVFDEDGEIEGLVELSQEITDRERTRRALLASEKRYRVLFESTGTATLVYRDDGVIQLCNERFAALAGLPKEEIEGRIHWREFVHPEELERLERYHAQRSKGQGDPPAEYEFTFVNAQGETRDIYIHIGLLEETGERVASLTNVTPLKEAQEALRESEERYRLHFENVSDVLYAIDRNFVLTEVSPSVERLMGYRPEELIGRPFADLNLLPPGYLEQAAADTKRVMRGERASSVYQFVTRDGTLKWGEISAAPLTRDGEVTAMIGVARDITERRRAQEALKESQSRLLTILNSIDAHIYAADMDSHEILFMNQQMQDDFGGDRSGEICYEAFRRRQTPCPHCTNDELVDDEGRPTGVHVWEGHNPVTDRWYINHDRAVEWVDGRIVRLQIATDITERRRTEEALRESQLKFHLVTDTIEDVFWMRTCDIEDTIYVSPGYETIWERSRETLYQSPKSFTETIHRHDLEGYLNVLETCHRQGRPYETEYRVIVDNSDARWIHERGYPVRHPEDGTQLMAGVCTDVTARKEAERALRHAESRYRNLVERIPAVTYVAALDEVGSTLYVSPQVETLWGYSAEEWMADPKLWSQRIHPDDRQRVFDAWEHSTTTGEPFRAEYRILHRDGRVLWGRDEAVVVQDEAGEPQYVHGVVRDVTERKHAQQERERLAAQVRDQARRMEKILATVPTGVLLLGGDGRVLQANPTGQRDLKELASAEVGDVITRLGDRRLDDLLTSPPEGLWHEVEADSRTFEAIARPVEPRRDAPGSNGHGRDHWVLVVNDVTRERRIDAQLHQQERLAAVGQLAGGIAHDFNNILASIILYAQLPLTQPGLTPKTERALETVLEEADRAADLVQQILDFSRKAMMETKAVSLTALVNDALALLRRTIPENIHLVADLPSQPCVVQGDATRIHQVLMNLALNAKDAMPEGGELSIQVESVTVGPDDEPPVPEMKPGSWAQLTVSDTGTGMSREVRDHLFEPFFTTKPEGKGTGLGLAQVYGIVKQHQGFIDVETAPGEGTTFRVFLALDQQPGADEGPEEDALALQGQGETILVVEDAKRLRLAIRAGLESAGYEVVTAANGLEAMELISEGGVDLVLTDVVMPRMGGEALLRNVRENHPDLKMTAMTGHVMDTDIQELKDAGFSDALPKPFSIEELSQVVRDVLDE